MLAFVRVVIESHSAAEAREFEEAVARLEAVVACYSIAGDADFLLQVVARDLDHYADFAMGTLRALPRIKEMQTNFVLKELTADGSVPQDDGRQAEKRIQALTDEFTKKVDELAATKEQEILQV